VRTGVAAAPEGAVVLAGYTLPGLANAHSHAFQRAFRGKTEVGRGTFWTWREQMYRAASRLDPDSYFALARATFGEMALAGVTSVGEFHYVHHGEGGTRYADPNAMGVAVIAAAREAGIRITLIDACYLHGGIGEELNEVQRRFSDGTAEQWTRRVEAIQPGPGVRLGAAIHSVRAVAPEEAALVADWARGRALPLHAHVSEQPAENEACRAVYRPQSDRGARRGRRPLRSLHRDPRHPSERARPGAPRRGGRLLLLLPDDRARPGRRHRAPPRSCARPARVAPSAATRRP